MMKSKLMVLGAGESGLGTAILGTEKGYDVFVSDNGKIAAEYKDLLIKHQINFEEYAHSTEKILEADLVMKSPGIPDNVDLIEELKKNKVPVISEIEFSSKFTDATLVGITGSNGKTTTTLLTYHLLKNSGMNVGVAGNIGESFAQKVAQYSYQNYVLEISSFQLDGIEDFRPDIAMILNITPDHLDRYNHDFDQYVASKFRITKNQKESDYLIYDADDPAILKGLTIHHSKAKKVPFSITQELNYGAFLKGNELIIRIRSEEFIMNTNKLTLQGKHNFKNAMAATMASQLLEVRNESLRESLSNFEGAEHRLESVLKVNEVHFINDSKATNVNATFYALECMDKPTVWIVGGVDKGNDYDNLLPLVREKVRAIVCLGEDNSKIITAFGNVIDVIVETKGAEEAVKVAYKLAEKGDAVLLSPACASFDLFENYEDRGRQFKTAVRAL